MLLVRFQGLISLLQSKMWKSNGVFLFMPSRGIAMEVLFTRNYEW